MNPNLARDARAALAVWDEALDGDSNDAEHEAALGLAEELRTVLPALELACRCCVNNECECEGRDLVPEGFLP